MDYLAWNDSIARAFFNPQAAQRPVYLYVTDDRLDGIGRAQGADKTDFLRAVLDGPAWITDGRLSLCGKAHRAYTDWRQGRAPAELAYPPYIAYLSLFVLAAGVEGDFAAHAYYPRLRQLLNEPDGGAPPAFEKMWELWFDLEEWSKVDQNGDLGVFNANISGGWMHVGLPVGQTLLSEEERHKLISLFAACALDPTAPPGEREMLNLLREDSDGVLQRRSRRMLSANGDAHVRAALVQAVIAELQHWDGTISAQLGSSENSSALATLRLCCRLDEPAGRAIMRLRLKSNAQYPDGGLCFKGQVIRRELLCEEEAQGWSTELVAADSGMPIDAAELPWRDQYELIDRERRWRAIMPASGTRLPRGIEFMLIACEKLQEIEEWGRSSCLKFRNVPITAGLEPGWKLYHSAGARDDAAIRDILPRLALPSSLRISFKGGVRTQDGSAARYFAFAPPVILVDSANGQVSVTCNGAALAPQNGTQVYLLPGTLQLDAPIRIEATTAHGELARASLVLSDGAFSRWQKSLVRFDQFGERSPDTDGLFGAMVYGESFARFNFNEALPPIPANTAYLIGAVPGQISSWPSDSPPAWQPIWAVAKSGRQCTVIPCMEDIEASDPVRGRYGAPKDIRLWKEVVWHWRKRVNPPRDEPYASLWAEYREAARNA
jgi:hypothetical protein